MTVSPGCRTQLLPMKLRTSIRLFTKKMPAGAADDAGLDEENGKPVMSGVHAVQPNVFIVSPRTSLSNLRSRSSG